MPIVQEDIDDRRNVFPELFCVLLCLLTAYPLVIFSILAVEFGGRVSDVHPFGGRRYANPVYTTGGMP